MRKHFTILITACFCLILSGFSLKCFAYGDDVIVDPNASRFYSNARVSVAYDGTIYYARIFSLSKYGPVQNWEIQRSTNGGVSFEIFMGGGLSGSSKCVAIDIVAAGNNVTDFRLFFARSYIDTTSKDNTLYMSKITAAGGSTVIVSETYNYTARGWSSLSLATDGREKNKYSDPYSISLAAVKAAGYDSIIVWTDNVGGTNLKRVGVAKTAYFYKNVSIATGSTSPMTSSWGRLGIAWDTYNDISDTYGSIHLKFLYPDNGTSPVFTGPYLIGNDTLSYRNPCVIISQDTAGGTAPGDADMRVMVMYEYNNITNSVIDARVCDSIIAKAPDFSINTVTVAIGAGDNQYPHGVFDPVWDNFLITYYNTTANTLSYSIKSLASAPGEAAGLIKANYRDASTASPVPICPRVDIDVAQIQGVFGWNDNYLSMFDTELSTVSIKEATVTGIENLKMFPNPANSSVNIKFTANESQQFNITISDLTGRVFYNQSATVVGGENNFSVDLNHISAGNYIVSLRGESINSNLKLIVTK
ncbi:MAG: T9SS type A sorting domain-containing protein [Bacteroidales bacterium]|nr:T9SS type A sorting domain-containing protein [Bacteroidales bacterium]